MNDKPNNTANIDAQLEDMTGSLRLRMRSGFAVQHLIAAARFSRQCGEIQNAHLGQPLGPFFDEQISCVSATIMLSVASLEANINEYLSDPAGLFPGQAEQVRLQFCELIGERPLLEKCERVLAFNGRERFDRGESPYQDVDILIAVRNELVHFHPEWHDEQERHAKLGKRLMYRFPLSPFLNSETAVVFPQRFISHGCTQWAVESALAFMNEFARRLGVESRFATISDRLST